MSEWKQYYKATVVEMRPYVPGEDMTGISVSDFDKERGLRAGSMIARNSADHADQWYINRDFFNTNYRPVE
jgi:hypothetical protein